MIGSSGGGSATISSGEHIVDEIQRNLKNISHSDTVIFNVADSHLRPSLVSITEVAFVQSSYGLDFSDRIQLNDSAKLWVMNPTGALEQKQIGSLADVNRALMVEDERIASLINSNQIDAIITISSDPMGQNKLTILAAVHKNIPIIGTGGTSMSCISTMGGNVIGCSGGSVATTGVTRGICIAASFASYPPWGHLKYQLPNAPRLAKFRSIVGASLPVLLSLSLLRVTVSFFDTAIKSGYILIVQLMSDPLIDSFFVKYPLLSNLFIQISSMLLINIPDLSSG